MKSKTIKSQKDLKILSRNTDEIITKAKFGRSTPTRIPLSIDENLSFFIASIIGDGHIKKNKFQINLECANPHLIKKLKDVCYETFNRKFNSHKRKFRENRKPTTYICIDSKSICNLLEQVFETPRGKKSHIVKVPDLIKKSNKSIKAAFLIGIMVTEGGKRKRRLGLSTASKELWIDLQNLFNEVGIKTSSDRWINKKYNKEYYGISFQPKYLKNLTNKCKSKSISQIITKFDNLKV